MMPPLPSRILITADAVGGVWNHTLALAAGLAERGAACTLALLGPPASAAQTEAAAAIGGLTVVETGLPLEWTASAASDVEHAARHLAGLARRVGAATLHAHTPALAAFDWPMPVIATSHSCVGTWWEAVGSGPPPESFVWQMQLMRQGLARAQAVIAPSRSHAAALARVYGPVSAVVIHNGISQSPGVPRPAAARQRRVLTAGRLWDRAKNVAILEGAASWLPVDAAGHAEGPDGSRFESSHIRLLGQVAPDMLRDRVEHAAVFVSPSRYEPFGLAVLEAACAGTPLVLADIATFRELWDGAACFVRPQDGAAWTDALLHLLDTPDERDRLGALACERARRYDVARMVDETAALHAVAHAARAHAA